MHGVQCGLSPSYLLLAASIQQFAIDKFEQIEALFSAFRLFWKTPEVTVHRPPGTGSFFGRFQRRATRKAHGRKMCLSPCGRGGQSHFRGDNTFSRGPRRPRRENWDSPRERLPPEKRRSFPVLRRTSDFPGSPPLKPSRKSSTYAEPGDKDDTYEPKYTYISSHFKPRKPILLRRSRNESSPNGVCSSVT